MQYMRAIKNFEDVFIWYFKENESNWFKTHFRMISSVIGQIFMNIL